MKTDTAHVHGFIICFIGIDGSGKTTLARALLSSLQEHGIPCEYVWGRFGSVLVDRLVFLYKKAVMRRKQKPDCPEDFQKVKSWFFHHRFTNLLYASFVLVDYLWQVLWKIWRPHLRRKNLVCDRYVQDSIFDLAVDLGFSVPTCLKILDLYLRLAPEPDMIFIIDLPEQVALARKGDIPSLEYLCSRQELYSRLKNTKGYITLNGTVPPEQLHHQTLSMILPFMEGILHE